MRSRWLGLILGLAVAATPLTGQKQKNSPAPKGTTGAAKSSALPRDKAGMKGLTKAEREQRIVERFNQMPAEQQRKVLANMTPERRQQVERNLEQYRKLSSEQKARLVDRMNQLPPEKQQAARSTFRKLNQLPEDRRVPVRSEINRLNRMPEDKRNARLESEAFRKAYSPQEQQMITDMTKIFSDN